MSKMDEKELIIQVTPKLLEFVVAKYKLSNTSEVTEEMVMETLRTYTSYVVKNGETSG